MALAFDAASSAASAGDVASLTWAHTCAGADRLLVVGLAARGDGQFTSVTFNSVALTQHRRDVNGSVLECELWYLIAPGAVTANIVATYNQTKTIVGGAVSYTGADQTTPLRTGVGTTGGTGTPMSQAVTSATGEIVQDVLNLKWSATRTITVGAGQTQRWNTSANNGTLGTIGGGSTEAGAATVTMDWTTNSEDSWAYSAVSVRPSTGDATAPGPAVNASATPDTAGTKNDIAWTNPSDVDLSTVKINRRTDQYPTAQNDGSATVVMAERAPTGVGAADSYEDTGLTNSTRYYYAIWCKDTAGNFSTSAQVSTVSSTPLGNTGRTPANNSAQSPNPILVFPTATANVESGRAVHFIIEHSADSALADATIVQSRLVQTNWQYENPAGTWNALPAGGLTAANVGKAVRWTSNISPPRYWSVKVEQV